MTADSDTIGDFANPKLVEAGIKSGRHGRCP